MNERPRTELNEEDEKTKVKAGSDSLNNKLLDARTILVNGPVTDKMFEYVQTRLLVLEHKDPDAEILVIVNSPGGSADTGFGIYNTMKFVSCPVKTLCAGLCASAGVLIFLGGDKGKRYSLAHSRFLLHQPSTTAFGAASDMEITANEILRTRKKYAEVVAQEIGVSPDMDVSDSNLDIWLTADEALKYKLVDKVIVERKEMA